MKRSFAPAALLLMSITTMAQEPATPVAVPFADSVSLSDSVRAMLDSLYIMSYEDVEISGEDISDNPAYFRLFMPLVLYDEPVEEAVRPDRGDAAVTDSLLPLDPLQNSNEKTLSKMINEALLSIYLEHPELVKMTEQELMNVPSTLSLDETADLLSGVGITGIQVGTRMPGTDAPELKRSKLRSWKTFGNFQGKYTQSHYSDNWYKGGESNHSILGQINLEADYAREQATWDNKLELKLGYYTTEVDGKNTFRTNEDLIRITSKFGLKATNSWFYSAQVQGYTQFMPVFDTKVSTKLKSKFFAPAYGNVSVGMDYKPKFKNNKVTLSVLLSPFSYNCRYVSVDSIATNFGIDAGKNYKYTIGSRFDGNVKWKLLPDLTWTSKAQFYTSYESVEANLENTLDYRLTKYISLQFFCHWRFDDSVMRKKDKNGNLMGYSQFKEFLTLNFNYAW